MNPWVANDSKHGNPWLVAAELGRMSISCLPCWVAKVYNRPLFCIGSILFSVILDLEDVVVLFRLIVRQSPELADKPCGAKPMRSYWIRKAVALEPGPYLYIKRS